MISGQISYINKLLLDKITLSIYQSDVKIAITIADGINFEYNKTFSIDEALYFLQIKKNLKVIIPF